MRDAEKLMSRCIYLNILKATISAAKENEISSETLEKYAFLVLSTSPALFPGTSVMFRLRLLTLIHYRSLRMMFMLWFKFAFGLEFFKPV